MLRTERLYREGVSPQTRSVVSSRHRVLAVPEGGTDRIQVGQIASFDPSESRGIDPVRGIGQGDQVLELVPSVTEPMTISISRTALYLANIFQVFGYRGGVAGVVRSLRHHQWPFDLRSELVLSLPTNKKLVDSGNATRTGLQDAQLITSLSAQGQANPTVKAIITLYQGCWMNSYSTSYTSDTFMVQESGDVTVTDVVADSGFAGISALEFAGNSGSTGDGRASKVFDSNNI